jgi:DNA-binding MarR family transcriptional regulator
MDSDPPSDAAWQVEEHDWLQALLPQLIRDAGLLRPEGPLPHQPLSLSEGLALEGLRRGAAVSQRDLADRLGLEKSTVSRLIAGLERRGLVTRERDPRNRRFYRLQLTDAGRSAAERLATSWRERHTQLLGAMTASEREALAIGLAALVRALRKYPSDVQAAADET